MSGITNQQRYDIRDAIRSLVKRKVARIISDNQTQYDYLKALVTERIDKQLKYTEWKKKRDELKNALDVAREAFKKHTTDGVVAMFSELEGCSRYHNDDLSDRAKSCFEDEVNEAFQKKMRASDYGKEIARAEAVMEEVEVMITLTTSTKGINTVYEKVAEVLGLELSTVIRIALSEGKLNL